MPVGHWPSVLCFTSFLFINIKDTVLHLSAVLEISCKLQPVYVFNRSISAQLWGFLCFLTFVRREDVQLLHNRTALPQPEEQRASVNPQWFQATLLSFTWTLFKKISAQKSSCTEFISPLRALVALLLITTTYLKVLCALFAINISIPRSFLTLQFLWTDEILWHSQHCIMCHNNKCHSTKTGTKTCLASTHLKIWWILVLHPIRGGC